MKNLSVPENRLNLTDHPFCPQDLTLEQAMTVLALAFCTYDDEDDDPVERHKNQLCFAPSDLFGSHLINELLKTNLILKYKNYESLFAIDGMAIINQRANTYAWAISEKQLKAIIDSITTCIENGSLPDNWVTGIYKMALDIAIAECTTCYELYSQHRNFFVVPRFYLTEVITNLLNDYSVSQCHVIIEECARSASDYFVRTGCNTSDAAEYMLRRCGELGAELKSKNTEIPNRKRIGSIPQSAISHIFYYFFIQDLDSFTDTLDKVKIKVETTYQQH